MKNTLPAYQKTLTRPKRNSFTMKDEQLARIINQNQCNFDTFLKMLYEKNKESNKNTLYLRVHNEVKPIFLNLENNSLENIILNMSPLNVANVLKQTRIQAGYSLKQLEKLTGFSRTSISHRESSSISTYPNMSTLQIYLDSFNLSLLQFTYLVILNVCLIF